MARIEKGAYVIDSELMASLERPELLLPGQEVVVHKDTNFAIYALSTPGEYRIESKRLDIIIDYNELGRPASPERNIRAIDTPGGITINNGAYLRSARTTGHVAVHGRVDSITSATGSGTLRLDTGANVTEVSDFPTIGADLSPSTTALQSLPGRARLIAEVEGAPLHLKKVSYENADGPDGVPFTIRGNMLVDSITLDNPDKVLSINQGVRIGDANIKAGGLEAGTDTNIDRAELYDGTKSTLKNDAHIQRCTCKGTSPPSKGKVQIAIEMGGRVEAINADESSVGILVSCPRDALPEIGMHPEKVSINGTPATTIMKAQKVFGHTKASVVAANAAHHVADAARTAKHRIRHPRGGGSSPGDR